MPIITALVPVTTADNIKTDYSTVLSADVANDYSFSCDFRLYRDGTLIQTCTLDRTEESAGTQSWFIADTFVDTALATITSTYEVRAIFTSATNVNSAEVNNRDINLINFGPTP